MHSFQAEQDLLRLQMMEEMRCLRKSAAEEKMLLQREVEELTSKLSMKEREDVKHHEWQEEIWRDLQKTHIIKQKRFASELEFERNTDKALLDELETLRASNNEIGQRAEADNLRAGQQASHLKAELEKDKAQMHSFQAEQDILRLQMMEEMRCLRKSAAEEKMLLQREVEELTSQLSLKEREDVKHHEWQEEIWGDLKEAHIIKQQRFASELEFERSTNKALLNELEKLRASNNEISQRAEADNLRAGQQASHLKAELEKDKSQMHSIQAEQDLLRLQMMEEMRCLRKSAAEEKMLLQREVEELTSQLSLKKEREWQEERDEEKQEEKWGEEQQEKEEDKWGEGAGGGEPVDKPAYLESHSDALPASEPVETELSEETPKKKKSSIWKKIRQHLGLRRRKKQPHD
ncbi:unnamed protein product [Pleuronectes platessa]|uniref:Uncharacterized protein n=1 Tax=Pleuronectes platessa TaxID=8262 RepID=A0A9N7VHY5_PLEPL|nr:unnamed protein product [Pleuronectes platessa]